MMVFGISNQKPFHSVVLESDANICDSIHIVKVCQLFRVWLLEYLQNFFNKKPPKLAIPIQAPEREVVVIPGAREALLLNLERAQNAERELHADCQALREWEADRNPIPADIFQRSQRAFIKAMDAHAAAQLADQIITDEIFDSEREKNAALTLAISINRAAFNAILAAAEIHERAAFRVNQRRELLPQNHNLRRAAVNELGYVRITGAVLEIIEGQQRIANLADNIGDPLSLEETWMAIRWDRELVVDQRFLFIARVTVQCRNRAALIEEALIGLEASE